MKIMSDKALDSPEAIKAFLASASKLEFDLAKDERYPWITQVLARTNYFKRRKTDKSIIRNYLHLIRGYSLAQLD